MKTMVDFLKHIAGMPLHWRVWLVVLSLANMAAVLFLPRLEAWIVLGALVLGGMLQILIFSKKGFVRLLGLGHFHWFPMIVWIFGRIETIRLDPSLYRWIVLVTVLNGLSLIIDTVDVIRYARGEKQPIITIEKRTY